MAESCPACGQELELNEPSVALGSNDANDLRRLFGTEIEHACCEACGSGLGREPTVIIGFDDPSELLISSPPSTPHRDVLFEVLSEEHGAVASFSSVAALRAAVAERLRERIDRSRAVLDSSDLEAHLSSNWMHLTPDVFSAAALGLERPGYGLELPPNAGPVLASAQAQVWALAAIFWMSDAGDATLEDMLRIWIDGSSALPGALETLNERLDETELDAPWVVHYSQEAARATIHRHCSVTNPCRLDWATLFFGFELAARSGRLSSSLERQAVTDERAAATIDQQCAWIAAGELLRDGEDAAVLDDICAKVGHSGLVPALLDET